MARTDTDRLFGAHPLEVDERLAAAEQLQELLIDLVDLSLQGKQAHWNLVGPRFRSVHLQLDEFINRYREWSDQVAERLLALGVAADGRAATVARDSRLEIFPEGRLRDEQVVELLAERVLGAVRHARRRLPELGRIDPVSQDLVNEVVAGLEKQLWMLQATRV
jgi:starvation-inducible DNA-binding protein